MNPIEFVKTIYLGDRLCKSILIDGYSEQVKIMIDEISRIRDESGEWKYYNDENITNGFIVFKEVETVLFEPQGLIPNDEIEIVSVEEIEDLNKYLFIISATNCDKEAKYTQITIKIIAKDIYLESPLNLGIEIKD